MTWREDLHVRDARGRFARKGSLPAVSIKSTLANLAMASSDDLLDVFGRLMQQKAGGGKALQAVWEELGRREGGELPEPDTTPEQRKIDELVGRGWSYAYAYADAYNVDPDRIAAEQSGSLVDRRKGETLEDARRRAYRELVALQWLQAEEATNGYMVKQEYRGKIDGASLWSGPATRARKYASDELKEWWESNGGRLTYTEFRATVSTGRAGRKARQMAEASRSQGGGRDYGI